MNIRRLNPFTCMSSHRRIQVGSTNSVDPLNEPANPLLVKKPKVFITRKLPVKIETIETIKISNNIPNKPKEKRTFKSEVSFLNFKINNGLSKKYFNKENGKKNE